MKEKLLEIIKYVGEEHQRNKLSEEYRELQDELYKFAKGEEEDILGELVDVMVVSFQFLALAGYSFDNLPKNIERKNSIKEHTPKLRELEQLDKDNRNYVEEIVERTVNKKIDSIIKQSKLYDDISVNIAKKISDAIKSS